MSTNLDDPNVVAWREYSRERASVWERLGNILMSDVIRLEAQRAFEAGIEYGRNNDD